MTHPVPKPGPAKPGQHLTAPAPSVTPDQLAEQVGKLLADVDDVRAAQSAADDADEALGGRLVALDRQAVMLEQAHQVLALALEDVDRG